MFMGNPVTMDQQPQSATMPSGTNVSFVASANGMTNYSYQWRFNGTNVAGATNGNITNSTYTLTNVTPAKAGNYDVVIKNPINSVTSAVAMLTIYSATLNITNQPQSQTLISGTNASFTVGASGAGTLTYQWRFNGTAINGATNNSLLLPNVQLTNAGTYAVNVSDTNGSLLSSNATLSILVPPSITLQPSSRTASTGQWVTLTAAASGTPAPIYQWVFNGSAIAGATLTSLNISNFQSTNVGMYSMLASNSVGTAQTLGAELLLNSPLRFTNVICSNATFSGRLIGVVNSNYLVEWSTNFSQWNILQTNNSPSGISTVTANTTNSAMRVYRARSL
jgi:hypothetical protein